MKYMEREKSRRGMGFQQGMGTRKRMGFQKETGSRKGTGIQKEAGAAGTWAPALLKSLLLSYILTVIMLGVLALLLYKLGLNEKTVSIGIIVIYAAATFFGGFLTGKRMSSRKFLWGLLLGGAYFVILTVVSLIAGKGNIQMGNSFFTTLVLCAGGGMLGGMLS